LDQFSPSSLEIQKFGYLNQILLNLFNISSMFHNSIGLNNKVKMYQTT